MGFTVKQLLETEEMKSLKVLSGEEGISNEIKGVTIIEAPDIVKFIDGGELLLTGLYAFKSCSIDAFQSYVEEFQKKKISGIIIKRGRRVTLADEKVALLAEYAHDYRIPMIEVPFEVSFQMILSLVMEHLFGEEVTQLKYFKMTHDNFTALSLSDTFKEQPVESILDMLNKLIRNPVALYSQNMACYAATEDDPRDFTLTKKAQRYDPGFLTNYRYLLQKEENPRYIVRIDLSVGVKMYLVITQRDSEVSLMDCIAAENAIVALQYEFSRKFAVSELEKKFQNDILNNFLQGKITSAEEIRKSTGLLGIDPDGNYRVIIVGVMDTADEDVSDKGVGEKFWELESMEEALLQKFPALKIHKDVDRLVVVQAVPEEKTQAQYRQELKNMVEKVQSYMLTHNKKLKIKAGAGKLVHGVLKIPQAYREATEAFNFIDIMSDLNGEKEQNVFMFSDLGVFRLLGRIEDADVLREYVPESLQKLYEYKKSQRDDLLITLKTYLDFNQNLSKTAQSLYIHYKTASYRIEKIAGITGMDFGDADEMMAVRIGMVVEKMIEKLERK